MNRPGDPLANQLQDIALDALRESNLKAELRRNEKRLKENNADKVMTEALGYEWIPEE